MQQIDFKITCSFKSYDEISDKDIDEMMAELEKLLQENGFKKVTVNIV